MAFTGFVAAVACNSDPRSPMQRLDDKIEKSELREGMGAEVVPGKEVHIHYRRFAPDGRVKLDARDRGRPHIFVVGDRSTFRGLDRGIRGMRVGSIWELNIPPELHHGGSPSASLREARPGRTDPWVRYHVEIVRVTDPPLVDDTTDRVLPFAPLRARDGKAASPSKFPLINATRGWR